MPNPNPDQMQRSDALLKANEMRIGRSRLRHQLRCGELTAATVIADPPACATSWPMFDVLCEQRWWGREKVRQFLRRLAHQGCPVAELRAVGDLTERQRRVIVRALETAGVECAPKRAKGSRR